MLWCEAKCVSLFFSVSEIMKPRVTEDLLWSRVEGVAWGSERKVKWRMGGERGARLWVQLPGCMDSSFMYSLYLTYTGWLYLFNNLSHFMWNGVFDSDWLVVLLVSHWLVSFLSLATYWKVLFKNRNRFVAVPPVVYSMVSGTLLQFNSYWLVEWKGNLQTIIDLCLLQ